MIMSTQLRHFIYSGCTISQYFRAETYRIYFSLTADFFTERPKSLAANDIEIKNSIILSATVVFSCFSRANCINLVLLLTTDPNCKKV